MNDEQANKLVYQAFETELGGVQVYEAPPCVKNDDLREEQKDVKTDIGAARAKQARADMV